MKKLLNSLFTIVFCILVLFVVTLGVPRLLGYEPVYVTSASMAPSIKEGALAYIEKKDPALIKKKDVISFYTAENVLVTHRVVEIDDINKTFTTKGDANEVTDKNEVSWENVAGTVRFSVPKIGYSASFLGTVKGKICFAMLFLGDLFLVFATDDREKEESDDEEE